MKKYLILLCCVVIVNSEICFAQIYEDKDEFTNGDVIRSNFYCEKDVNDKIEWISFYKTVIKTGSNYIFRADVTTYYEYAFSKKSLEMNLDGGNTYILPVVNYNNNKSYANPGKKIISIEYEVSQNVINKLYNANRVALRFTQNNGNQFVYVLPNEVLEEWKQVIATKE